jgi:CelD/BcsL family acetyltransferase involved in cellulose biosynthesis
LVPYPGQVEVLQPNIVRSLDLNEQALWADVDHKVRKNVKRARACGVVIERDDTGRHLSAFAAIYESTLKRRGASTDYFFPHSFFEKLHASVPGQFMYFHARSADVVVSTELVLISADRVYSFLGGTQDNAFHLRPNDLLKYEVTLWAKREGKQAFVLGGGHTPGDGIFRYKKSFAPRGVTPFRVGKRVLNRPTYDALVESRGAYAKRLGQEWVPKADYFPAYRANGPLPPGQVVRQQSGVGRCYVSPRDTVQQEDAS